MTDTAPEPFDSFDDLGEFSAFLNRKYGLPLVQQVLAQACSQPVPAHPWLLTQAERIKIVMRESLETTAAELADAGVRKLAAIVHDHAADRPSELDLCPYPPGSINARAWFFRERQRAGLCPWCGSDKSPEAICDDGQPCTERWRDLKARAQRPA